MSALVRWIALFAWCIGWAHAQDELSCSSQALKDISPSELNAIADVPMSLMTRDEMILLWRYQRQAEFYVEFGSGGSSNMACKSSTIQRFVTIETNIPYLEQLIGNSSCLVNSFKSGRLEPRIPDIGPTSDYGNPIDESNKALWPQYSESVLHFYDRQPDLVLVDGRFRVASALAAILAVRVTGYIAIHDFFIRPEYYDVLRYTEIEDCVQNLIVLRPRPDIVWEELVEDLRHFQYIFK